MYSENKGADQLRGYREAGLCLFYAHADCWFSDEVAHAAIFRHKKKYQSLDYRQCKSVTIFLLVISQNLHVLAQKDIPSQLSIP